MNIAISSPFRRFNKLTKPKGYPFLLPYATSVLRILGWIVLVVGVIGSFVVGLEIDNGGLMIGTFELRGAGVGVPVIILGMVVSFLAWLFLLVNRELIYLFIHVEENTRTAAEHIAKKSDQG